MLSEEERLLKEAALTGLTGGYFGEIVLLLFVVPCSIFVYRLLFRLLLNRTPQWTATLASIFSIILPVTLAMSVFTEYTVWYCLAVVGLYFVQARFFPPTRPTGKKEDKEVDLMNGRLKPFLSNYRSAMMIATCFAIMAVDYNLFFPRRFAKCEEYGISLMDVGVGGFIFSGALVSPKSRTNDVETSTNSSSTSSQDGKASKKPRLGWLARVLGSLKMAIPLIILGFGRFAMVKAFGYQEHVSEYGMHWNFFMTLASITLLAAAVDMPLSISSYVGVIILVTYQYVLEAMGVADWIITGARDNFFSQNREGIFSCVGYFALYLFGQRIGSHLLQPRTRKQWWTAVGYCLVGAAFLWLSASSLSHMLDMKPSRRMVNMPYVLYTLSCNLFIISAFIIVDLSSEIAPHALFDVVATKRNAQLVIFMISNLMTGAVNVFVGTWNRSVVFSFFAMVLYMLAVSVVALFWHPLYELVAYLGKKRTKVE